MKFIRDGQLARNIDHEPRGLAHNSNSFPRLSVLLAGLLVLLAGSACQGQSFRIAEAVPQSSPGSSAEPDTASIVLELNRATLVLSRGLNENWRNRDEYLSAFDKTPSVDSAGRPVMAAKRYVECVIDRHLRIHEIWDEGVPIGSEVHQAITELTKLRKDVEDADGPNTRSSEFHLPPCISQAHRKIAVAPGVAAAMLKTKINPIYPAEALKHNVFGTVILHAIIGRDGHVTALQIIS